MAHRKVCKHCGGTKEAHHDYEPSMPEGCECNPGEWGDTVNDICAEYQGNGITVCAKCEHDEECHKGSNANVCGLPHGKDSK